MGLAVPQNHCMSHIFQRLAEVEMLNVLGHAIT
jgi:hypothetical protein